MDGGAASAPANPGAMTLVSVGYEGHEIESFVEDLQRACVSYLVDLRLTPISRKRGFSKTKLAESLASKDIKYLHLRALGNPKDNRDAFRRGAASGRQRYRDVLSNSDAAEAMHLLEEMTGSETVALLCFEHAHETCHRSLVTEAVVAARPELELVQL